MSSMSISGSQLFGQSTAVSGRRPPPPPGGGGGPSPVDAVKDVLGMSADDITAALTEGKSLNDLAESQGVSHDKLIAALKAGMPDDAAQRTDADQMLEELAAATGVQGPDAVRSTGATTGTAGAQGHHGHGHGSAAKVSGLDGSVSGVLGATMTSAQQRTLDTLSSLLGSDSESIVDALRSGTSLADLVSSKGLDSSSLASVIEDGLMVDTTS
jgi:lambda repressor-like predicted transcriptional regulator